MPERTMASYRRTCELQTAILDSTRRNAITPRDRDFFVTTWSKSGTTRVLQIVTQLLSGAPDGLDVQARAIWPEFTVFPYEPMMAAIDARRDGRRVFKTHLAVHALSIVLRAKYIYVGRDACDVVWSAYNHQAGFTQEALDGMNKYAGAHRAAAHISAGRCARLISLLSRPRSAAGSAGGTLLEPRARLLGQWRARSVSSLLVRGLQTTSGAGCRCQTIPRVR